MKKKGYLRIAILWIAVFTGLTIMPCLTIAEETLRYSCSAQIFEAFGMERLDTFTKETGIKVDLYVSSSGSAVYRLMNNFSDIASTAQGLYYRHKESGYVEIPFCKDPLAVIANVKCSVENFTEKQLQDIFSKHIINWKELGGSDEPIIVVVPGKDTAVYKNFERLAMGRQEILYDYMTYQSTKVIEAVENFPAAISFIAQGDISKRKNIKAIKVGGFSPTDKDYPYFQTFYYITKGEPAGLAKKFIDFTLSEKGVSIMKEKGMLPVK